MVPSSPETQRPSLKRLEDAATPTCPLVVTPTGTALARGTSRNPTIRRRCERGPCRCELRPILRGKPWWPISMLWLPLVRQLPDKDRTESDKVTPATNKVRKIRRLRRPECFRDRRSAPFLPPVEDLASRPNRHFGGLRFA